MANSRSEMHADKSGLGSSLDQFLQPSCGLLSFAVWWSGLLFQSWGFGVPSSKKVLSSLGLRFERGRRVFGDIS